MLELVYRRCVIRTQGTIYNGKIKNHCKCRWRSVYNCLKKNNKVVWSRIGIPKLFWARDPFPNWTDFEYLEVIATDMGDEMIEFDDRIVKENKTVEALGFPPSRLQSVVIRCFEKIHSGI